MNFVVLNCLSGVFFSNYIVNFYFFFRRQSDEIASMIIPIVQFVHAPKLSLYRHRANLKKYEYKVFHQTVTGSKTATLSEDFTVI